MANYKIEDTDIIAAINIIDTCATRGAFKGDELLTIGRMREKFVGAVKEMRSQQISDEEETP